MTVKDVCLVLDQWFDKWSNWKMPSMEALTDLVCIFGSATKRLYFAIRSPDLEGFDTSRADSLEEHKPLHTVNFVVKSWISQPNSAWRNVILPHTIYVCVYASRINFELNKHSRLTSSRYVDISCWLKTQLVIVGGMQNGSTKQPQISEEKWPIYMKSDLTLGSSRQRLIHCFSQQSCHCHFIAI